MTNTNYISMNGELVPYQDARIHVLSPAITYAATVFEGIRAYWNDEQRELFVFRLDEHLRRLQLSMRALRFGREYPLEELREQVLKTLRGNEFRENVHIRIMAMIEGAATITTSEPVTLAVYAGAFPNPNGDKGIAAGISTWQRIHDTAMPPRVKCTANYSNGRHAMLEARRNGFDAALMLTREGHVSEAPGANFFIIRDGKAITPHRTDSLLEGITRDTLLELMKGRWEVEERSIDRSELYSADEAFFCGSGWEITPVASIDRLDLPHGAPGPLTSQIRDSYMDAVYGRADRHAHWLTRVWQ